MKKSIVMALVACFVMGIAATALAFPVDVNGDVRFQFRQFKEGAAGIDNTFNGEMSRIRLNFAGQIDKDVTLFARLSARGYFGDGNDPEGVVLGGSSDTAASAIDQYGVKIKAGDWTYKLGRQAVNLGQGTIISTGYDACSGDSKFDGIVASGKMGVVDTNVAFGNTTAALGGEAKRWMGFDLSTSLSDTFTVGAAYGSDKLMHSDGADAVKIWAVNATFAPSKQFSMNGEYAKSNQDDNNTAYFLAGTYSWDKDSFSVQYNKVGRSAVDQFNSGIGAVLYPYYGEGLTGGTEYSGFTYSYNHQMSEAASLNLCYMDLKTDVSDKNDQEFVASVNWSF